MSTPTPADLGRETARSSAAAQRGRKSSSKVEDMSLRLRVETSAGVRELMVVAKPDTTVGELAAALADHLREPADLELYSRSYGDVLPRRSSLDEVGLLSGDLLQLVDDSHPGIRKEDVRAGAVADLLVVGGPQSGFRRGLSLGEHSIGRDEECTVSLDDRFMSREHLRLDVQPGRVVVSDADSTNRSFVEGVRLEEDHEWTPGEVIEAGTSLLTIRPSSPDEGVSRNRSRSTPYTGQVSFNRPPRVRRPFTASSLELPSPPADPQPQRLPMAASLAPLLVGVGVAVIMQMPQFLAFAALSPIMAIWSFIENRRSGKGQFKSAAASFRESLRRTIEDLEGSIEDEAARRREAAPSADELMARVAGLTPGLWERRPRDDDYLQMRLGWADQPSWLELELEEGGNEDLRRLAEEVRDRFRSIPAVPATISLREAGILGVAGDRDAVKSLIRWLLIQTAALHSPEEVKIVASLNESDTSEWRWLTWLPHGSGESSRLDGGRIAFTGARTHSLLEDVNKLLETRRSELTGFHSSSHEFLPTFIVVIDDRVRIPRSLLRPLLTDGPRLGFFVIWMAEESRDLPGEARAVIEVDHASGEHQLIRPEVDERQTAVTDAVSLEFATELAVSLARVRDTSGSSSSTEIPRRVALLELFDEPLTDPRDVIDRWSGTRAGLGGPVGAKPGGRFDVDLRRDGPHALVGGTTGAGKSELLQTLIVSLAASHPPTYLNFLLVDYKGGAAFKDCVGLPHTVGFVTDLDGHLVRRALISLNAELRHREEVLRDVGMRDLAELQRRDPSRAPASLAIVIDEFATLVKELPDFVAGVVDVAQRGRSLGVHLVLATQRPAGVINESIRANTNLRIALRVGDEADSEDVLGIRDAAHIPRSIPGRGFARTGQGEVTEFQTGYAGGHSAPPEGRPPVFVQDVEPGRSTGGFGLAVDDEEAPSDLQRLTEVIRGARDLLKLPEPRAPWLPPLPTVLPWHALPGSHVDPASATALGLVDEPHLQRQSVYHFDFEQDGNLLVFGTSGSGKTTLLRTIGTSVAASSSPEDVHIYGLDFATRGLEQLKTLPHCGAVIAGDDVERVTRLYRMIQKWVGERKDLFASAGASTLSEYRRANPRQRLARIIVLLDGYGGFVSTFERIDFGRLTEALPSLVGEGRSLGVHFIVAADRRGSVPLSLSGVVPTKVVLKMADDDDYATLGLDVRIARIADLRPGRGFVSGTNEFHAAIFGGASSGEGQAAAISALATELRSRYGDLRAPGVGSLPTAVSREVLPIGDGALQIYVGIGDKDLQPVAIDLEESHVLVVGPHRSGRSTALATIALALRKQGPELPIYLLAPRRTPLTDLGIWTKVARGVEECEALCGVLEAEIHESRGLIVVDDAEELLGTPADSTLSSIVKKGRDTGSRVVAGIERQSAQRAYSGFVSEVKKDRYGILLKPDAEVDGDLMGVRLPRRSNLTFPAGRGYLIERGDVELAQFAQG